MRLYRELPKVGDLVGFTDEIIDILREEALDSPFVKYYGQQLKITGVTRTPSHTSRWIVKFLSVPLCMTDTISLECDGTIAGPSSDRMRNAVVFFSWTESGVEPKNNDGREECFWCPGVKTKIVDTGFSIWRTCPNCGR